MSQSNHNFVVKNGFEAGGQLIVNAQGQLVAPVSGNTLPDVGTAGTYGDSAKRVSVTIDAKGRVSAVTELPIPVLSVNDTGGDGALSYNAQTGVLTYTGPSASEVRASLSAVDAGGDGSFSYDAATGAFTFTGPSAAEVRAHLSAGGDLAYDAATGVFSFTERTDSEVRGLISLTDAGGDGSASYDATTGVITVTGPSAAETRAHLSAGTGITYDAATGVISAGQALGSSDDVEFNSLVLAGDLTVNGTTTTVNSSTVTINDPLLHLADSNDTSDVLDMGFVAHYSDGVDQMHTGLFRDATTQKYHLFQGLTQDLESTNVVDISDASFEAAALVAGAIEVSSVTSSGAISGSTLTGIYQGFDSDFTAKSTTDLSEGDNLYYTTARADSDAKNAISGTGSISYDPATGIISATAGAGIQAGHGLDFSSGVMSVDSSADIFINKVVAGTADPGYGTIGFETVDGHLYTKNGEVYAYNGSLTSYYGDVGTHAGNLYTAIGDISLGTTAHAGPNFSRIVGYNYFMGSYGYSMTGASAGMTPVFAQDSAGYSIFVGNLAGGRSTWESTNPAPSGAVAMGWQALGHTYSYDGFQQDVDEFSHSVSIGYYANTTYSGDVNYAYGKKGTTAVGAYAQAWGYASNEKDNGGVAVGFEAKAGQYCVAIGNRAGEWDASSGSNYHASTMIGTAAVGYKYSTAVGYDTTALNYAVAIGTGTYAYANDIVVGRGVGGSASKYFPTALRHTDSDGLWSVLTDGAPGNFEVDQFTALSSVSGSSLQITDGGDASSASVLANTSVSADVSTSSTSAAVVSSFPKADFRSAKYTVQTTNSTDTTYQTTEILLIHDGTDTHITEFGLLHTGDSSEADFSAAINGANVELSVTPRSGDSMVHRVVRHAIA